MSAFEDFVQTELPKRPYLSADAALESIMVRRGAGPRQLAGVALAEGQVLALVGGTIVSASVSSLYGARNVILPVAVAATTWTITHAFASTNAIIQVVDTNGYVVQPDEIRIASNSSIVITFNTAMTGTVRAIFLD